MKLPPLRTNETCQIEQLFHLQRINQKKLSLLLNLRNLNFLPNVFQIKVFDHSFNQIHLSSETYTMFKQPMYKSQGLSLTLDSLPHFLYILPNEPLLLKQQLHVRCDHKNGVPFYIQPLVWQYVILILYSKIIQLQLHQNDERLFCLEQHLLQ